VSDVTCEAKFWGSGKPCHHKAKYLAPFGSMAVCGIHARGLLRCIPIADFEPSGVFGEHGKADK
jgi:hypothetical protein